MIVHESGKVKTDSILDTLKKLARKQRFRYFRSYLENGDEYKLFLMFANRIEADKAWHFETYENATVFCTARYC